MTGEVYKTYPPFVINIKTGKECMVLTLVSYRKYNENFNKGRYALAIMLDLAMNNPKEYIALKDIATRQEISIKYLEK